MKHIPPDDTSRRMTARDWVDLAAIWTVYAAVMGAAAYLIP